MKTKKKIKPFGFFLLLLLFIILLIIINKPYNYSKVYNIDKYKIIEKYDKTNKYYKFIIENNNTKYSYIINEKYKRKRQIIDSIEVNNNNEEECIIPKSKLLNFYPLCSKNNEVYSYNISLDKELYNYKTINSINDNYNKIDINYLNNKEILIYNYKGFYLPKSKKDIKLFNKDIYNIELFYQFNNYLLIPNYNNNYFFNKIYIINMLNGKIDEFNFDINISFNSVFLGDYKNNIYLLDKKEEKEYKININKKKIEECDYLILENNKLINTNFRYIINNNIVFENNMLFNYKIIDNYLYEVIDDINIKLSNKEVDKIIKIEDNTVYYLVKDKLYMYNNIYGEVLLLSYYEWNFNNTNMIFISK